jgi:hypothetical protein
MPDMRGRRHYAERHDRDALFIQWTGKLRLSLSELYDGSFQVG